MVGVCYTPKLQSILHQWPLGGYDWLAILVAVVLHICFVESIKFLMRRFPGSQSSTQTKTPNQIEIARSFNSFETSINQSTSSLPQT